MPSALLAAFLLAVPAPQSSTGGCPGTMVFFDSGSTRLTATAIYMLDSSWIWLAEMIRAGAWLNVIAGADDIGPDARNLALSRRRAEVVRRYFLRRGVPAGQIRVEAYGEARPFALFDGTGSDRSVRAQNRYAQVAPEMPRAVFERFFPPGGPIC
jgi:outer membrane protein OmpA-like peptidoglycan-associated protein